jgi:hypothetical protein
MMPLFRYTSFPPRGVLPEPVLEQISPMLVQIHKQAVFLLDSSSSYVYIISTLNPHRIPPRESYPPDGKDSKQRQLVAAGLGAD